MEPGTVVVNPGVAHWRSRDNPNAENDAKNELRKAQKGVKTLPAQCAANPRPHTPRRTTSGRLRLMQCDNLPPIPFTDVHLPAFTDHGEPAVFFSKEEMEASLKLFLFSVIAKTTFGRPAFPEIHSHLVSRCDIKEPFVISAMDNMHLLLRFKCQDDYLKVLLRESIYVQGKLFQFFKWTPLFKPSENPTVVPVWVEFPELPINLYQKKLLASIAGPAVHEGVGELPDHVDLADSSTLHCFRSVPVTSILENQDHGAPVVSVPLEGDAEVAAGEIGVMVAPLVASIAKNNPRIIALNPSRDGDTLAPSTELSKD
ncbi:hypothetical protein Taro_022775 [Colocasia esculenta]|uniref:DUF4283 domain-containing protein n=1 Tax=Colocasia esculenta TaxID=4460 RepID=A0A843V6B4_COLES|nr:hypothetical protein [Colocasia esculenta]